LVTVNPAGDVAVEPGQAASVCASLASESPTPELRDVSERLRAAERVALVWSGDDETGGRHLAALANALGLGEGSGAYFLPRTPNGRGVAAAWAEAGEGETREPPAEGEIGALIVSGDEAAADPRVADLAARARFVVTSAMFMGDHTLWAHVVLPGTSYLERDGTTVNLEGRRQRLHRTVPAPVADELEWLSALGERLGVPIEAWATGPLPPDRAELPERANGGAPAARPTAPAYANGNDAGLRLLTYRSLFSGPAVERVEKIQFQRPHAELELSHADAELRGIRTGDGVIAVSPNGTSRPLTARVNRRLRAGVVRIATDHAEGLEENVEVSKA
jgi:anaerobic selenocysteine-containing dehydrogenase